jgi:hypothetical protein
MTYIIAFSAIWRQSHRGHFWPRPGQIGLKWLFRSKSQILTAFSLQIKIIFEISRLARVLGTGWLGRQRHTAKPCQGIYCLATSTQFVGPQCCVCQIFEFMSCKKCSSSRYLSCFFLSFSRILRRIPPPLKNLYILLNFQGLRYTPARIKSCQKYH